MIDVIGLIYPRATLAQGWKDGDAIPQAEPLDGWHVNVTPELLESRPELLPFVVVPARLRRVWSGDDPTAPTQTVALRFFDEVEAAIYGMGFA